MSPDNPARTLRAMIYRECCAGGEVSQTFWQVFVATPGSAMDWPTFRWPINADLPTSQERGSALESLGFEVVPGAEWEWNETTGSGGHGHPARAELAAGIVVRLITPTGKDGGQ